jgi:hypothetical protein
VQTGAAKKKRGSFGAGGKILKRELLHALGPLYVCLINHDLWGRNSCAEFTRIAPLSLFILSLTLGPTWTKIGPSPLALFFFSAKLIFFNKNKWKMVKCSNGNEKLQIIYRWKAIDEENTLEQFIFSLVHCKSLALKEKEIGCEV